MDKKLLNALENLSFALEEIAEAIGKSKTDKPKSEVGGALTAGDLDKKVELIDKGVKQLLKDNKTIIKNQETIISLAKGKKEESVISEAGDKKKSGKVKDGIATIISIAVGVLAIGMAFKLIGQVDFSSVMALALALPLIAFAFEKIADINVKNPLRIIFLTVAIATSILVASSILTAVSPIDFIKLFTAMAIAGVLVVLSLALDKIMEGISKITGTSLIKAFLLPFIFYSLSVAISMSSEVLRGVKPVNFLKLITAIMIAGAFAALGFSLGQIVNGLSKINASSFLSLFMLPLVFVALSMGIAQSSEYFRQVKPVNFLKLITAILIGGVFAVLGYGLGKIMEGFKGMSPLTIAVAVYAMPIVLVSLSEAIAKSSDHLRQVKPVNLIKLLVAFAIGLIFIPLSAAVVLIAKAMQKVSIVGAMLMPFILVELAGVIYATSVIFDKTVVIPYKKLLNIVTLSIIILAISFVFAKISKMVLSKLSIADVIKGGIILIAIAGVITTVSWVLNEGTFGNYPKIKWTIGVAMSLGVFGAAIVGLGFVALTGVGALAFAAGVPLVAAVALTIVGVSKILAAGNYVVPGMIKWAVATAILYSTFAPLIILLGTIGLAAKVVQFFGGGNPFEQGRVMICQIAQTIVDVSFILKKGKYTGGPTMEWAGGVAIALGAFSPIYAMLVANKVASFFTKGGKGGIGPDDFALAIKTITSGIIDAANAFAGTKAFEGGPKKEWAEGVGGAIAAFSPLYKILLNEGIMKSLGMGGVSITDFKNAIQIITTGVVDAAKYFADNSASFDLTKAPKKEWAEGVGSALGAFSPLYKILMTGGVMKAIGIGGVGIQEFKNAIEIITTGIVDSAKLFADNSASFDLDVTPEKEWAERVSAAIQAFMPALNFVSKNTGIFKGDGSKMLSTGLDATANGIVSAARILAGGDFSSIIPEDWTKNMVYSITTYLDLSVNKVYPKREWLYDCLDKFRWVVDSITSTSEKFQEINKNVRNFNSEWIDGFHKVITTYVDLVTQYIYPYRKWLWDALEKTGWVVKEMRWTAKVFAQISKMTSKIKPDWMDNVDLNIRKYVSLIQYLVDSDPKYKVVTNAVSNLNKIAKGYTELAKGVSKLNTELEKIDMEKLSALRSLTGSIILMSLMDSEQFTEMMDALEEKAKIFVDVINQLESEKAVPGKELVPGINVGGSSSESEERKPEKTITDLWKIMFDIDEKLGFVKGNSDSFANFLKELKAGTFKLKATTGD